MKLRLFCIGWLLLFLVGCTPFAPHTLTVVTQPHAEAWTRYLDETPLRQTFIFPYNQSVNEIELVLAIPTAAPDLASRPLTWRLVSANNATLREGVIETAGFLNNTPIRLRFETLPAGESVDLALTAPANAQLALWRTIEDRYPQGTLIDNNDGFSSDLVFTLRTEENPATIRPALENELLEWERAAEWLPWVILPLGWMFLWLLGSGEGRPRAATMVALSLGAIPVLYLWFTLLNIHLYLPLARSVFSIAAALTLFVMARRWRWLWLAWRKIPIGAMTVLGIAILLSIATWLLAGRDYLAPPGTAMLESGMLAQEITANGVVPLPVPPLPPAALTSILSTLTQIEVGNLLIFSGLVLAVAAVPALFAFTEEITEDAEVAVWLLPLAWAWQGMWNALAQGDWFALYSYALMPVAFALGLRALRVQTALRRALVLAAIPMATLFLVQGVTALLTWVLTIATAIFLIALEQRSMPTDDPADPSPLDVPTQETPATTGVPSLRALLPRSLAWLFIAFTLLAPTLVQRLPVLGPPDHSLQTLGYDYLLVALVLALLLRLIRGWLKPLIYPAYAVVVVVLLMLAWGRSAPLPPATLSLQPDEQSVMTWMEGRNTPPGTQSLINLERQDGHFTPIDGTFWSPVFNRRATAYSVVFSNPALLSRALEPGALEDAILRDELRRAGITHVLLGVTRGTIRPADLQNQSWARLAYQSGGAYLFELVSSDPTAQ